MIEGNTNIVRIRALTYIGLLFIVLFNSCKKHAGCENCDAKKPPVAYASAAAIVFFPADSVLLDGSLSTDADGSILSYRWTKLSGPVPLIISSPASAKTFAKQMVRGTYIFQLTVTDNDGLTGVDTVHVVLTDPVNTPPVANAGANQTITAPTNAVTLNGSASSDAENNISSYSWRKIEGPQISSILTPNLVQTLVTGLLPGTYRFELRVTDAGGLSSIATTSVFVNPLPANSPWTKLSSPTWTGGSFFLFGLDAGNMFMGETFNSSFHQYNNQTNTWIQKGIFPGAASDDLLTFSINGKCYKGLGFDANGARQEMFQYDPATEQWSQKNNAPIGGYAIPLVTNNSVILVQGSAVWQYNSVSDTYVQKNNFPGGYSGLRTSFVIGNTGYLIAGLECWRYNNATDTWQQRSSLPRYGTMGFSAGGYGYVLSDSSAASYNFGYPLQLWKYDPSPDQWIRTYNDYPGSGAYEVKTLSLNGITYLGFGYNGADYPVNDFWKFQ